MIKKKGKDHIHISILLQILTAISFSTGTAERTFILVNKETEKLQLQNPDVTIWLK